MHNKILFYSIQVLILLSTNVTSNINKTEHNKNVDTFPRRGRNNLFRQRDRSSPTGRVNSSSNSPERRYPRETAASRRPATNSQLPGPSRNRYVVARRRGYKRRDLREEEQRELDRACAHTKRCLTFPLLRCAAECT